MCMRDAGKYSCHVCVGCGLCSLATTRAGCRSGCQFAKFAWVAAEDEEAAEEAAQSPLRVRLLGRLRRRRWRRELLLMLLSLSLLPRT